MANAVSGNTVKFNPMDPIGTILDSAMGDVEKSMQKIANEVRDAATDVILKAAEQSARLIPSLKAAYEESLQLTYQKADKLIQENIDRLNDLVQDIIKKNEKALLKIADRVGDIVKFSPLSNWWLPLLSEMTPRYFAVRTAEKTMTTVLVTFAGNFAYADQYPPTFTLNGRDYKPVSNTTKELKFSVEVSSDDSQLKLHGYSFLTGTLKVDWKSSYLFGWKVSTYKTLLGMLPTTPGKISVIYEKAESTISKTFASDLVNVSPCKKEWTKMTLNYKPDKDCDVVRGSSALHWIDRNGQTADKFISDDHNQVSYEVSRKDGRGIVQVVFTESQKVAAVARTVIKEDLRWGESWIASPNTSEKITKIVFEAFNGSRFEFQPRTDTSNPFVELRQIDGTIQISAKKASEINENPSAACQTKVAVLEPKENKNEFKQEFSDTKDDSAVKKAS